MRYRRQGFYDYDNKAWRTFYVNDKGKIRFDAGLKSYNQVRKDLKKNVVKRSDDLVSKKESVITTSYVKTRKKWQNETDKLLKRKRLNKEEKEKLKELSEKAGYKREQVKKRTYDLKVKKPYTYTKFNIAATYHSTTSTQFYIADTSFKRLKNIVNKMKKNVDKLKIEFEGMEGNINKTSFKSVNAFEEAMTKIIEGYGKISFSRGKFSIKIIGLKR